MSEVWQDRRAALVQRDGDALLSDYRDGAYLMLFQERGFSDPRLIQSNVLSAIKYWYLDKVEDLDRWDPITVLDFYVDEPNRFLFFVWSTDGVHLNCETNHFVGQFRIQNQMAYMQDMDLRQRDLAGAAHMAAEAPVKAATAESLFVQMEERWWTRNIDSLMGLYTDDSQVLFFDQAGNATIQSFKGLASIRSFFENEVLLCRTYKVPSAYGQQAQASLHGSRDWGSSGVQIAVSTFSHSGSMIDLQAMMKMSSSSRSEGTAVGHSEEFV